MPGRINDPEGYKLVDQLMMHDPCGIDKPNNSCIENGICTKISSAFCISSCLDNKEYINYKRRDLFTSYVMKNLLHSDQADK